MRVFLEEAFSMNVRSWIVQFIAIQFREYKEFHTKYKHGE